MFICFTGAVKDGLSTYVQEPLAVGRRGSTGRDLNEKTVSSPVRESVAYDSDVSEGVQVNVLFLGNMLFCLHIEDGACKLFKCTFPGFKL